MLKIIDYGRSYFKDGSEDSQTFYDKVICQIPECNTPRTAACGYNVGFGWLKPKPEAGKIERSDHLNTHKKNTSYDLWALSIIKNKYLEYLTPILKTIMKKVSYDGSEQKSQAADLEYKDLFAPPLPPKPSFFKKIFTKKNTANRKTASTRKRVRAEPKSLPELIRTVQDAANYFAHFVAMEVTRNENNKYHKDREMLGDLHVYLDGTPMVFDMADVSEANVSEA